MVYAPLHLVQNTPPLQNDYRHENIFESFSGILPKKPAKNPWGCYRDKVLPYYFRGLVRALPFAPQKKGLLLERGSYQNKFQWNCFLALAGLSRKSPRALTEENCYRIILVISARGKRGQSRRGSISF